MSATSEFSSRSPLERFLCKQWWLSIVEFHAVFNFSSFHILMRVSHILGQTMLGFFI